MWSSYLLTLYRSLTRHRLYAALNIGGLALGFAVFLVLSLMARHELSYDRWIPDADRIHRLSETLNFAGSEPQYTAATPGVVLPVMLEDFPQIEAGTRLRPYDVSARQGSTVTAQEVVFVDTAFFDVFDLPLITGDTATALADPLSLVVNETTARKYFGDGAAVGRSLTLIIDGQPRDYRVSAIMADLPSNTSLKIEAVAPLVREAFDPNSHEITFDRWFSSNLVTYIKVANAADAAVVDDALTAFKDRRGEGGPLELIDFHLTPLLGQRFADVTYTSTFKPGVDANVVTAMALTGVAALAVALLNYINLATARGVLRSREVALRKVMGGRRQDLMRQFLFEALLLAAVAALIGVALAELALPLVNATTGTDLSIGYLSDPWLVTPFVTLVLLAGVGAGLYPAILLSGFQPAAVLASTRTPSGGRIGQMVRESLVTLQFATAVALVVCTTVIFAQTTFLRQVDVGFDRDGLVLIESLDGSGTLATRQSALDALRRVPGAQSVTLSNRAPSGGDLNTGNVSRPGWQGEQPQLASDIVGPDYFETLGIAIVAGRPLGSDERLDDIAGRDLGPDNPVNIVLSESGVEVLRFDSPAAAIGQRVFTGRTPATVVGVSRDVRFVSPREMVYPHYYLYSSNPATSTTAIAMIRTAPGEQARVMAAAETAWRGLYPNIPFVAETAQVSMNRFYEDDERRAKLFAAGAAAATVIGCLGLYGLVAFTTSRRTREIGVRKAMGASTLDVLRLLGVQTLRPVVVANLIAWPLAWWLMQGWLADFDQRIDLSPTFFLAASLLALLVAALTIAFQAVRAARRAPADALRYE